MDNLLFFIVILFANVIQGITGFAGTILAMPFSIIFVGYHTAKPVLNVLGLLSGIYIFLGNKDKVSWEEVKKIIFMMTIGIFIGFFLKSAFMEKQFILYKALGFFIIFVAIKGFISLYSTKKENTSFGRKKSFLVLSVAGIIHGIFVSGGPLLISYLTKKTNDKTVFRATISTVWIVLNTIIFVEDIIGGLWNVELLTIQLISIPFMLVGMFLGGILYTKMSQELFMKITYVLLFVSGISLIIK